MNKNNPLTTARKLSREELKKVLGGFLPPEGGDLCKTISCDVQVGQSNVKGDCKSTKIEGVEYCYCSNGIGSSAACYN